MLGARGIDGLSGLAVSPDGARLVAVGDLGAVLVVRPETVAGRLAGLADARAWRRRGEDGRPVAGKAAADAEALAHVASGDGAGGWWIVAVEQGRRLLAYPDAGGAPGGTPVPVAVPREFAYLVRRGGLEALAVAPPESPVAGSLFVFHETVLNGERRLRAWRGAPARPGEDGRPPAWRFRALELLAGEDWSVTGAAFLPGGDLLLLERRYRGGFDISMRIRRIGRDALAGDVLDGPTILEADATAEIDNMEGIAVSAGAGGRPIVDIVSDDNASFLQRTLLLRFELAGPAPRPRPASD